MYYCGLFFEVLTVDELTAERHLIVGTVKLNQHKGILIQKLSLRICCIRKEVPTLFPQKMRTCGFFPG